MLYMLYNYIYNILYIYFIYNIIIYYIYTHIYVIYTNKFIDRGYKKAAIYDSISKRLTETGKTH